jgi:SAM-dependent methyltransferase
LTDRGPGLQDVASSARLLTVLGCRACGAVPLQDEEQWEPSRDHVACRKCGTRFPVFGRIIDFTDDADQPNSGHSQEAFWISYYQGGLEKPWESANFPAGDRDYPRYQLAFRQLIPGIEDRLVLDFGCGRGDGVAGICSPDRYHCQYVGIDISLDALQAAQDTINSGTFLRSPAERLKISPGSVDVLISLGFLMNLDDSMALLHRMIGWLKPGGYLVLHENIRRPPGLSRSAIFQRIVRPTPFPNVPLDEFAVRELLEDRGNILVYHKEYSALRTWMVHFLERPMSQSRFLTRLVLQIDQICIRTLGKLIGSLAAGELLVLFRKS